MNTSSNKLVVAGSKQAIEENLKAQIRNAVISLGFQANF